MSDLLPCEHGGRTGFCMLAESRGLLVDPEKDIEAAAETSGALEEDATFPLGFLLISDRDSV